MSKMIKHEPTAIQPSNLAELEQFAHMASASGFFSDAREAAQAMVKIAAGAEMGIPPIQAMTSIHVITALGIIAGMALALYRGLDGPTLYDRILAVNSFGTNTVLMIAVLGFLMERPDFLDIALVYALINFIGTIAVLKFFEYQDLGKQTSIHQKQK